MTDAQFLDWQAHDNWSAVKVASAGPGLGLATSAAALSPAIAAAEMLYGGVQSVRDLNNGHYIRGTVGLALSVVGARGLASEWRSVNSVRSALYNSNASVLNAGQPTSLNGAKALDRWAIDGDVADTTLSVEAQFQANSLRAADEAHALFEQGINDLSIPRNEKIPYNTQAGGFVDQFVRKSNLELRDDLGLDIGSVRINQRLYAPDGSYTIPDLYFPESGNIIDYSYQLKTLNTPQIQGFRSASPNGTITIVPPSTIRPIYVVGP